MLSMIERSSRPPKARTLAICASSLNQTGCGKPPQGSASWVVIALGIVTSSVVTGGHSLYSFCSR